MKISNQFPIIIIMILFVAACKKDGAVPVSSVPTADPYVRKDNLSSDMDHQIYELYTQTGIPILYSDTLTKNPLKILNLNYLIGGASSSYKYSYPKKKTEILTGIAFVRDRILPPLGKRIKLYSISLLDTLKTVVVYSPTFSITTNYNFLPGLTSFGIANVPKLASMTDSQLSAFRAEILANMMLAPLNASGKLKDFFAVSSGYYGRYVYGTVTNANYLEYKDKKEYGFIPNGTESIYSYLIGDQNTDLKDFLMKTFTLSAANFQIQYGSYPLVMNKYAYLKSALAATGFDLTKL